MMGLRSTINFSSHGLGYSIQKFNEIRIGFISTYIDKSEEIAYTVSMNMLYD